MQTLEKDGKKAMLFQPNETSVGWAQNTRLLDFEPVWIHAPDGDKYFGQAANSTFGGAGAYWCFNYREIRTDRDPVDQYRLNFCRVRRRSAQEFWKRLADRSEMLVRQVYNINGKDHQHLFVYRPFTKGAHKPVHTTEWIRGADLDHDFNVPTNL